MTELRDSELHLALLAWKAGDITMIELKKLIAMREREARIDENKEHVARFKLTNKLVGKTLRLDTLIKEFTERISQLTAEQERTGQGESK